MPYDLTGRAVYPLNRLIELADFPLIDFLPTTTVQQVFDGLFYADASSTFDGANVAFDLHLAFYDGIQLALPGSDVFSFGLGVPGQWNSVKARLIVGPELSLTLRGITMAVTVAPTVLKRVSDGQPASLTWTSDIRFAADGISVLSSEKLTLTPSYLCGTDIIVEADRVLPAFQSPTLAGAVVPDFQGLYVGLLSVTVPQQYFTKEDESGGEVPLVFSVENAVIGSSGFSGAVSVSSDPQNPITGKVLGFPYRFRHFTLDIKQNSDLPGFLVPPVTWKPPLRGLNCLAGPRPG